MSRLATLPRRLAYTVAGSLLSAGAPLGLLVVRLVGTGGFELGELRRELGDNLPTYIYVTLSTLVVFSLFGCVLGRQADTLVELSRTDALTELRNPRAFEERLEDETARAARYGEPLSLLLVDVDGLEEPSTPLNPAAKHARVPVARLMSPTGPIRPSSTSRWPPLTETLRALLGERQDRRRLSKVMSSGGLDLPPLVVNRHPNHLADR